MQKAMLPIVIAAVIAGVTMATTLRADPAPAARDPVVLAQDTLGRSIFTGKGTCFACHGPEGKGTPLAPDLTDKEWLNITGELKVESIVELINKGVPTPKKFPTPMLPKAGVALTDAEVRAVATYVFSLSAAK
ncbi:MAG: cytochrome c [Gemmatimonadetes bacterium]|nr:cytochrome c [Gemmatimonadota bacterium]